VGAALGLLALSRGGRSLGALVAAAAATVIVGRLLGRVFRPAVPIVVIAVATWFALTVDVTGGGPLAGPFGYRNATAAFFAQAAIAGLMLAVAFREGAARIIASLAGAAVFTAFAWIAFRGSTAGAVTLLVVIVVPLALAGPRGARAGILATSTLLAVVFAATVFLAVSYRPGRTDLATRALTERRVILWHESLDLLMTTPFGVGPGRFREIAPTAIADADAGWSHNEFLQQAAELGWPGLVLTVLLFTWGFVRLWIHPAPDAYVTLGAASLAALGVHACVDYVLHFPAVPLTAAALVGTAQAVPLRRSRRDGDEPRTEGIEGGGRPDGVAGASSVR
jgi:O-antigen ligase